MIDLPQDRHVFWAGHEDVDMDWARSFEEQPDITANVLHEEVWHHTEPLVEFMEAYHGFRLEILSRYIGVWSQDSVNLSNTVFCRGFPHVHNNDLTTVSVVLQAPHAGGENLLKDQVTAPVEGHGLVIGGREMHGVYRVFGPQDRIAMILQYDRR